MSSKRRRVDAPPLASAASPSASLPLLLLNAERGRSGGGRLRRQAQRAALRRLGRLAAQIDVHAAVIAAADASGAPMMPAIWRRRAPVAEMAVCQRAGLLFVLLANGLCPVFSLPPLLATAAAAAGAAPSSPKAAAATTPRLLAFLNEDKDDVIRSILLSPRGGTGGGGNNNTASAAGSAAEAAAEAAEAAAPADVLVVSVRGGAEGFHELRCRAAPCARGAFAPPSRPPPCGVAGSGDNGIAAADGAGSGAGSGAGRPLFSPSVGRRMFEGEGFVGGGGSGGSGSGGGARLVHPSFVEFAEDAARALVFVAPLQVYRIYSLEHPRYQLLFTLPAAGVRDVKLSAALLAVVREPRRCSRGHHAPHHHPAAAAAAPAAPTAFELPVDVYSSVNGRLLASRSIPLASHGDAAAQQQQLAVCELVGDVLLTRAPLQPLRAWALPSFAPLGERDDEALSAAAAFLQLPPPSLGLFLTATGHQLATWSARGLRRVVEEFEDHALWSADGALTCLSVNGLVVSCCRPKHAPFALLPAANASSSIHLSVASTGQAIARLAANDEALEDRDALLLDNHRPLTTAEEAGEAAVRRALSDVTVVLFDDDAGADVWSANHQGVVALWVPG